MPDEPTLGELWRLVERVEKYQHDQFDALSARLDRVLTIDVWAAERRDLDRRITNNEQGLTEEEKERKADVKALRDERDKDRQDRKTGRRWVVAGLAVPVAIAVVNIVLFLQVGGAG